MFVVWGIQPETLNSTIGTHDWWHTVWDNTLSRDLCHVAFMTEPCTNTDLCVCFMELHSFLQHVAIADAPDVIY